MIKLCQYSLMSLMSAALVVTGCTTEDPRGSLNDPFFANADRPKGNGEACEENSECRTGFTCYRDDPMAATGACTAEDIAAACTAAPSCGNGLCNVRPMAADLFVFCRCPAGEEWNGETCVMGGPDFPGSELTGQTCPEVDLVPGTPDENTADCPTGTFCTAEEGGDCLRPQVTLSGMINGATIAVDLQDVGDEVGCIREYLTGTSTSAGIKLVLTATAANAFAPGATQVTIDLSDNEAVAGGTFIVWPQVSAPGLDADSIFADVSVDGALGGFSAAGIAGAATIDESGGPDENEDDILDDGDGFLGGTFFIALGGDNFLTGSFVARNCTNEFVSAP